MSLTFGVINYATSSESAYSIITGTENAQFPLDNLKHPFTTKVFRSLGNTVSVLLDTKGSDIKNMFAVSGNYYGGMGFNAITIEGSASTVFDGSNIINVPFSDIYNFGFIKFPNSTFRYWKITITSSGTYTELSNIFLGEQIGLTTNTLAVSGFEYLNQDNASFSVNPFNQKFITSYNKIKRIKGSINYINREEFDTLKTVFDICGISIPVWFIYDESDATAINGRYIFSGYYYFTKSPSFQATGGQLWNSDIELEEVV